MHELLEKLGKDSSAADWLRLGITVARRRAIDWLRSPESQQHSVTAYESHKAPSPASQVADRELARLVERAGFDCAETREDGYLWYLFLKSLETGAPSSLGAINLEIWPDKHRATASRRLARLLKRITELLDLPSLDG